MSRCCAVWQVRACMACKQILTHLKIGVCSCMHDMLINWRNEQVWCMHFCWNFCSILAPSLFVLACCKLESVLGVNGISLPVFVMSGINRGAISKQGWLLWWELHFTSSQRIMKSQSHYVATVRIASDWIFPTNLALFNHWGGTSAQVP